MMLIFPTQKNHLFHILMVKFLEQFIPENFCSETANQDTFQR